MSVANGVCASCGAAGLPLENFPLAPALESGVPAPSVFLCEMCRRDIRHHISESIRAGHRRARNLGIKIGQPQHGLPREGQAPSAQALIKKADARALALLPIIEEIKAAGARSLEEIAFHLTKRCVPTSRGGEWSAVSVHRAIKRANKVASES